MKRLLFAFVLLGLESGVAAKVDFFEPTVVPTPVKAEWTTSVAVPLEKGAAVLTLACGEAERTVCVAWLKRHAKEAFGFECEVKTVEASPALKGEAYEVSAEPAEGVVLRAAGLAGVRHAFYTLRQIVIRKRGGLT